MFKIKRLNFWQKVAVCGAIIGTITVGSYGYYLLFLTSPIHIVAFDNQQHTKQIVDIFNADRYWLTANPEQSIEYMLKYRASDESLASVGRMNIRVLEDHGKVVGFTTYYMDKPDVGRVLFLAIDKNFRGKRYGEKLLRYAIEDLIRLGATKKIWLATRVENYPAQALYKRVGFVESGKEHGFLFFDYVLS